MGASKRQIVLAVIAAGFCTAGAAAQVDAFAPEASARTSEAARPSQGPDRRALSAPQPIGAGGGAGVPNPCPQDVNGDGSVNVLDLIDLLLCFGQPATGACGTGQDINQDGTINVLDLIELLLAFGQECLANNCQLPDNLPHGVVLAGFSTCTPGSIAGNESAFAITDDFNIDVTQTVDHVRWWGVYATQGAVCDPTLVVALQNFEINYYANDADGADNIPGTIDDHCPGANLLNHIGLVTSVINTGRIIGGVPVWEFGVKHTPIVLTAGSCYHLSIRARMDLLDPVNDCMWAWQTAGDPPAIGNGRSLQQGDGVTCNLLIPAPWVCPTDANLYDLAWCLQGPDVAGQVPIQLGDPTRCLPPPPLPPDNDTCAGRFPLTEPGVPFTTLGAFTDGPPADPLFCITQGGGPFNDVWYNYTAALTGLLTLTTCVDLGGSADIDTVIVIYDGCICNPAPPFNPLGPQIGCNDCDQVNPCGGAPAFQSTLTVPVVAGQCYKVQLGGFAAGDFGSGFLAASCGPFDKDLCIAADPIAINGPIIDNTTLGFGVDIAPVCNDQVTGLPVALLAPGVWYSVIGDGSTLTATTCNDRTLYDTALSVYCAPCNDLFCVGANNDDPACGIRPLASTVTWCSAPGQEYLIVVHGASAADTGPFGLTVSSDGIILCPDPAPCETPPSCLLEGAPGATCQAEDTSNANNINPVAFTVADDFTPLADSSVTSGCVWVITLDFGTVHSLRVRYYLNDPLLDIPDDGPPIPLNTAPLAEFSLVLGTLTQVGPDFMGTNVAGFIVQQLGWSHAPLALAGGVCHWIEIADTTPTSSAFWERGLGGNAHAVQDGVGGLNGYDALDIIPVDFRFCLDIVWDLSDCAPVVPPPPPPVNNACAARIPLLNGLTAITTISATTDGLATNGTGDCLAFGDPQVHNDIWFNYTAPAAATTLVVATCPGEGSGGSSGYDTKIAVYDGCATALCPLGGTEIACNDDDGFNGCAVTFEATVIAPVVAGNCYKVRVGGFGVGDSGIATLSVHN